MIYEIEQSYDSSAHNGKARLGYSDKSGERSPWELLAWSILEQAVDDLANLCRWGIITPTGKCLPWPKVIKRKGGYMVRVNTTIAGMRGPNDHREIKAFFASDEAQEFCDLVGCRLPAAEIFANTIKHHGGPQK